MPGNILIPVDQIWKFYSDNHYELESQMMEVANNEPLGYEVYITKDCKFPMFQVELNDSAITTLHCYSKDELFTQYEKLIRMFIDQGYKNVYTQEPEDEDESAKDESEENSEDEDESAEIYTNDDYDRLDEIYYAFDDFLQVFMQTDPEKKLTHEERDDLLSIIGERLYEDHGISVNFPTDIDGIVVQNPFEYEPDFIEDLEEAF